MIDIKNVLRERILVLDGALGTMIQKEGFREQDYRGREFLNHGEPLAGFNDILTLTKPSAIKKIHSEYLEAGADIITTNTFNSNAISMQDYGLEIYEGMAERLNREGALLAKEAVNEFKGRRARREIFVGGSIGPTNRSASMSPDITDPLKRNITYDELLEAYKAQVKGLIEGGVDLLICETFFDTLNLKAAIDAANTVMQAKGVKVPIMVSATVSDNAGRILSGQTLEAFMTSVAHYENIISIGVNCGFGPDRMENYLRQINGINVHYTSCHPNAGLPDEAGCYNIDPEEFGETMKKIMEEGRLNIAGGCCGTTPEHIKVLSGIAKECKPRQPKEDDTLLRLSGLDMLTIDREYVKIGERCNVAGSAKFLRIIKAGAFEEASVIAGEQVKKGAKVIDLNLDDPLLDAKDEMVKFLRYLLAEPEVAKVPFMIDSSKWEVIEAALKNIQGKGIVNSLSLKEGEEKFIERARRVKELGFALVVMAFDEKGQADTYKRKVEICERAYHLLVNDCGFNPSDIIFDVNIMTIGTGMKEHSLYAVDFINAVAWIKNNLKGARTSGGVSNLSFAFRGKNKLREYMHVIFLHHAISAGLDMAIVNPSQNTRYEDIPENVREAVEDLIFNRSEDAVEKVIAIANEESQLTTKNSLKKEKITAELPIDERLKQDLVRGELLGLEKDIEEALREIKDPIKIIEGPLLEGMKTVGDLFGEGKMFLPQVVKTARSMKRAVELLTPYIENYGSENNGNKAGKILIATVKGDVHDIGKNIVSTVLACNNYEIIDLGIMVAPERIVEVAREEKPDIICLSGLITPSLSEMTEVVRQLKEAGIEIPVMVGGAATSLLHTVLKIDSEYGGCVFHLGDASQNPILASRLMNKDSRDECIRETQEKYEEIRGTHKEKDKIVPYKDVLKIVEKEKRNDYKGTKPKTDNEKAVIVKTPLTDIIPLINWRMFFLAWKLQGAYLQDFPFKRSREEREGWKEKGEPYEKEKRKEALELYETALEIIEDLIEKDSFDGMGMYRIMKASGETDGLRIGDKEFPMLRQQREGSDFLSCADYTGDKGDNFVGLFAVTAGRNIHELSQKYLDESDNLRALVVQTLADRLAEASAEWLQRYIKENIWDVSIRPAWGYPMLPDQTMILETQELLPFEEIGIKLTENGAMYPPASVSGLYFSHPDAKYFMVGRIGDDQIREYARKRGISENKVKEILRQI